MTGVQTCALPIFSRIIQVSSVQRVISIIRLNSRSQIPAYLRLLAALSSDRLGQTGCAIQARLPHALVCSSTCDWREAVAVLSAWLRKSSSDRISREIWVSSRPEVRLQSAFCSNVWNSANRTMSWSPSQIMIRADPMPPICSVL